MAAAPARRHSVQGQDTTGVAPPGARDAGVEGVDDSTAAMRDTVSKHQTEHHDIAQVVVELLRPTIMEAIHTAIEKSLHSIKEKMSTHAQCLDEAETRVAAI